MPPLPPVNFCATRSTGRPVVRCSGSSSRNGVAASSRLPCRSSRLRRLRSRPCCCPLGLIRLIENDTDCPFMESTSTLLIPRQLHGVGREGTVPEPAETVVGKGGCCDESPRVSLPLADDTATLLAERLVVGHQALIAPVVRPRTK